MEGKLHYAIAVFFGDDPKLYWLNYNQDAAKVSDPSYGDRNGITLYDDLSRAESFLVDLATVNIKENYMTELDGLLLKKIKLLGNMRESEDGLHIAFRDDIKMQVYKVMIGTHSAQIHIKEPASTLVHPIRWTGKVSTTMTDAERAASDAAWERTERDREARGAMM